MIFPGFPGVLSFFQVFQVEWEPWGILGPVSGGRYSPPPGSMSEGEYPPPRHIHLPEFTRDQACTPPKQNDLTDPCENITYPQLLLRAVINMANDIQ